MLLLTAIQQQRTCTVNKPVLTQLLNHAGFPPATAIGFTWLTWLLYNSFTIKKVPALDLKTRFSNQVQPIWLAVIRLYKILKLNPEPLSICSQALAMSKMLLR